MTSIKSRFSSRINVSSLRLLLHFRLYQLNLNTDDDYCRFTLNFLPFTNFTPLFLTLKERVANSRERVQETIQNKIQFKTLTGISRIITEKRNRKCKKQKQRIDHIFTQTNKIIFPSFIHSLLNLLSIL